MKRKLRPSSSLPAGQRLGDVEIIGADAFVGVEDVELDQHANRRIGVIRTDPVELSLTAGPDELVQRPEFASWLTD